MADIIHLIKCPHCKEIFSLQKLDECVKAEISDKESLKTLLSLEEKGRFKGMNCENFYDYGNKLVEEGILKYDWSLGDMLLLPSIEQKYNISYGEMKCLNCGKMIETLISPNSDDENDEDILQSNINNMIYKTITNEKILSGDKEINLEIFQIVKILQNSKLLKEASWNENCGYTNNVNVIIEVCTEIFKTLYKYRLVDLYCKENTKDKIKDMISEDEIYLFNLSNCKTFLDTVESIIVKYNVKKNILLKNKKVYVSQSLLNKFQQNNIELDYKYELI